MHHLHSRFQSVREGKALVYNDNMGLEIVLEVGSVITIATLEGLGVRVGEHVPLELPATTKGLAADQARLHG